jgi:hypothetical protein
VWQIKGSIQADLVHCVDRALDILTKIVISQFVVFDSIDQIVETSQVPPLLTIPMISHPRIAPKDYSLTAT